MTIAIVIGAFSTMYFANNMNSVKARQEKVQTSMNQVTYEALNEITMNTNALSSKIHNVSKGNLGSEAALEKSLIKNEVKEIDGHVLISESTNYQLYFFEESLSIIIRDKSTGAVLNSTVKEDDQKANKTWQSFVKSGIVLQVLKGINIVPTTDDVRNAEKTVTITENGFIADVNFAKYGIEFQLKVSLDEDGLHVEIPNDSIQETSDEYKIGEIYVYPFLGNTYLGERAGYMFVPDGNGALIYLEDNEGRFSSNFSQYVYGMNVGLEESYALSLLWYSFQTVNEADRIMAPVYGMVHTDSNLGFLAVIEGGEFSAKIEAYPNGAYTNYNWVTSKFILRQIYTQPTGKREGSVTVRQEKRNEFDIKINYRFVNGEEADYTGLSTSYRDYLLEENLVKENSSDFKMRIDFLGTDKEPWMIFKRNVVMTTVDNIKEIYGDLAEDGVTSLLSIYKGWQKNGINSIPISKFEVEKDLASKEELVDLVNDSKDRGVDLYLYQDALRVNPELKNANYNVMKQISKRVYEERAYKYVFDTFRYLVPTKSKDNMESSMKSYVKNDINQVAISGISNTLFTYRHKSDVYGRTDTAKVYEEAIANVDKDMDMILEKGFQYLWKYSEALYDMPVSSSNYIFVDSEIPFLSMALKGIMPMYGEYINFEADKQKYFLQLVEMGIFPSFYITYEEPSKLQYTYSSDLYSSEYGVYKDTMVEYYKELELVNNKVAGAVIDNHEQYSNGVTIVTYSNGVKIYINYNTSTAVLVDGHQLEPMSYKVGE